MRILTVLFLFILAGAHAQTAGDYRTKASGSWLNPTIWERYNGSVWQDANSAPSSSDGVILLRSGHSVVVPSLASVNVDQLILAGSLTVEPTGTLNVMNGS